MRGMAPSAAVLEQTRRVVERLGWTLRPSEAESDVWIIETPPKDGMVVRFELCVTPEQEQKSDLGVDCLFLGRFADVLRDVVNYVWEEGCGETWYKLVDKADRTEQREQRPCPSPLDTPLTSD